MESICEFLDCEKPPCLTLWVESELYNIAGVNGDNYSLDLCAEHYDRMVEYYRGLGQRTDAR